MSERVVHCWMGHHEWVEKTYGWDRYIEVRYIDEEPDGICMLPDAHDGPHVWTPDDQITVSFTGEVRDG